MKWGSISAHKLTAQKKLLCLFHCKARVSGVSLESPGVECISQVPENREDVRQNHDARKDLLGYSFSLKVKGGYISVQKLESERSKTFAVSISLKTKKIRS